MSSDFYSCQRDIDTKVHVALFWGLQLNAKNAALRPKDICIHLDAAEEHGTNVASLPASYRMMSG